MRELKNRVFWASIRSEVVCSLLVSFTFFFFGPLEIFLSSPSEFWFSVSDVIGLVLISTLLSFIIILVVLYMASFLGDKVLRICISILGAIGLGFYIQGNWTFINYGVMDGSPINWSGYTQWAILNTIIWILILSIVVFFCNFKTQNLVVYTYIMLGVIGVEVLTLGTIYIFSIDKVSGEDTDIVLEGGHEFQLSSNKNNIIVILADGFDGADFLPVLDEEPDFEQYFDGFTFYEDTCGTSLYSEQSGITQLTGNQLEADLSFKDNVNQAYDNTNLYDLLEENNYVTYLYLQMEKMVSPVVSRQVVNLSTAKKKLNNQNAFVEIYKMVSFRYMPHVIKKFFWYTSMDFLKLKGDNNCLYYNYDIYNLIQNQGIITSETNHNIYQFFWIQGPHGPVNTDRYCHRIDQVINNMEDEEFSSGQFEQTIGVVRMYTELINALKEAEIYDNTTIIFTADHGWDIRPNPCLLIKPANTHGELVISDVPVSLIEDYLPTLEYFITEEKDFGDSIYDLRNGMERERPFYLYYRIPDSLDSTCCSRKEKYYKAGAFSKSIHLGEELLPDDFTSHALSGFSDSEHTHIWTDGMGSILYFNIDEEFNNLQLDLNYDTYNGIQPVKVYANNILVTEFEANGKEEKSIIIPNEYVRGGRLKLEFQFTNAAKPVDIDPDNVDEKMLALAFYGLKLSDTSE